MNLFATLIVFFASSAFAAQSLRWTYKQDTNANLSHIVERIQAETGYALGTSDFVLDDDRDLATSHYSYHLQAVNGVPLKGMGIRIWKKGESLIQMEAAVENPAVVKKVAQKLMPLIAKQNPAKFAEKALIKMANVKLVGFGQKDQWTTNDLVRTYTVPTRAGRYQVEYSFSQGKVIKTQLLPYPNEDADYSVPGLVYPIYEEVEETHEMLSRVPVELKYILKNVQKPTEDPYANLNKPNWFVSKMDEYLATTPEGQAAGYWSYRQVQEKIKSLKANVPYSDNSLEKGQAVLSGRYTTIQVHPDAFNVFQGIEFAKNYSMFPAEMGKVVEHNGAADYLIYYLTAFYGKPFSNTMDLYNRPAVYDTNHNPTTYLNAGFDEVQVYYGVTKFVENFQEKGFTDPELSTRPFQSILFDPNIEYRDNAFYWNDTINFTTYSPGGSNFARDNTTIWHELGHGMMDRLMGAASFDGAPGFSEGFADFAAELVINDVTGGANYPGMEYRRPNNNIGFNLTNEEHDDGEAYGGVLRDILLQVMKNDPKKGLLKFTDLTLEMMRLVRHHPNLNAVELHKHLMFADELGREGLRAPGEFAAVITENFMKRNFDLDESTTARFNVSSEEGELTATGLGSRYNPILLKLAGEQTKKYTLKMSLKDGEKNKFKYPVTVKATFKGSPLQGNVHFDGEENGAAESVVSENGGTVNVPITVGAECDGINTQDDGCKDYIHLLVFNAGAEKPVAKKRFYVKVNKP